MRSEGDISPEDLTAKALIRNTALRLFAERGPDAVTVRQVAAAASVSPALVMHHFQSKAGLRAAVDDHVTRAVDAMFDALAGDRLGEVLTGGYSTSLAAAFLASFPPGSPLPAYLRRLLLTHDPTGDRVFARWYAESERVLAGLEAEGIARPSINRRIRAAFLLVNDLAALLLARQVGQVCGIDLQTNTGMTQWAAEAVDVYSHGAFHGLEEEKT
jgi:AcrR family transcriptional regulator